MYLGLSSFDRWRPVRRRWAAFCAGLVLGFGAVLPKLEAQTNFYTICTNGPASNRINIVLLAEGFRAVDYGLFRTNATNVANALLGTEPFSEYSPYVNIFAIAVPSVETGSDHPSYPQSRNTYFNSTYDAADYLITIPTNSTGQGNVDALLATFMPLTDLAVILVNDNAIGGSDNGGKTAISSTAANSLSYVPIHESGHVLGKLGDEYTNPFPGYPDTEEPNTTRETSRALIKWNAWVAPETPVPTPVYYSEAVGLFEGAHYHATGWYRPQLNCLMNSAGVPFCAICREALVLAVYRRVRPIAGSLPASQHLTTTSNAIMNFSLTLLQPSTHTLNVQWLTNGVTVPGATNSSFAINPSSLVNTTNVIAARVSDPTTWVRSDPTNVLVQTQSWSVVVSLRQVQLRHARALAGGKFAFQVAGVAPQGFVVQGSSNFITWIPLHTNSLANGIFEYTNQPVGFSYRWYRAVALP